MLLTFLQGAADALWGTPMTVVLVGMGLYLSLRFRFYYNFRHWGFHFRNTFGKMFQKGEGHGTVSGFAAACTAMANTIGVGNIGGWLRPLCPGDRGPYSGCGCPAVWACPPKPVRSSWASGSG